MTTKEFIQYINDQPELCEKLAACTAPEEVYAIAKTEGVTDSQEEFVAEMIRMKDAAQIAEADLETVSAAGQTTNEIIEVTMLSAVSWLASAYAAAAI